MARTENKLGKKKEYEKANACLAPICAHNERNKTKSSSPASIVLMGLSCGAGTSERTIIVKICVRGKIEHDENAIHMT